MKTFVKISIIAIILTASSSLFAQKKDSKFKTETFTVSGVCGMCKDRIENAALIKGVKFAQWDKMEQELIVIYRPDKVKLDKIHEAVAEAGHDTDKVKAKDEVYKKLPACCAYRDGVEVH